VSNLNESFNSKYQPSVEELLLHNPSLKPAKDIEPGTMVSFDNPRIVRLGETLSTLVSDYNKAHETDETVRDMTYRELLDAQPPIIARDIEPSTETQD
jgi:hypothetical protein